MQTCKHELWDDVGQVCDMRHANMVTCERASMAMFNVCRGWMDLCGMRTCEHANMRTCEHANMRTCEHAAPGVVPVGAVDADVFALVHEVGRDDPADRQAEPFCMQHATCNMQHATRDVRRATCDMQHAKCNIQFNTIAVPASCNMRHATCDMRHAA